MARMPDYRLQALFEIREKAKEEAEEFYQEKRKVVVREEQKLAEMKQKLRDMVAFREAKRQEYLARTRAGDYTIHQIQANDRHIEKLKQEEQAYQVEIQRQAERVRDAEEEAEEAMQALLLANQDFKALEKHKEKWEKQVRRERMLKEEEAAEDIAQAQYFQRALQDREE